MKQPLGAMLEHPDPCQRPNLRILRRVCVQDVDRDGSGDLALPDLTASHSISHDLMPAQAAKAATRLS